MYFPLTECEKRREGISLYCNSNLQVENRVLFLLCCRLQIIFLISFLKTEMLFSSFRTKILF